MSEKKNISAQPQPDGDGHQVSYETGDSRRVHHFPQPNRSGEQEPHSAGSFHNPDQHHDWIDRVEAYLKEQS